MAEGQVDTTQAQNTQTDTTTAANTESQTQHQTTADTAQVARPDKTVEDVRVKGLTADLIKERASRQKFEKELSSIQARLTERDRQFQALAGVRTPSEQELAAQEIRQQLKQVMPELGELTAEDIKGLKSLLQKSADLEATTGHYWQTHSRTMTDGLISEVEELAGGDLTERQKKALVSAYITEAEDNPEFLQKHERGDRVQIKQFAKEWAEDWLKIAQRRQAQQDANRNRPVPRSGDRNVQTTPPKKIDFNNPNAVGDAMLESFKAHGGRFEDKG